MSVAGEKIAPRQWLRLSGSGSRSSCLNCRLGQGIILGVAILAAVICELWIGIFKGSAAEVERVREIGSVIRRAVPSDAGALAELAADAFAGRAKASATLQLGDGTATSRIAVRQHLVAVGEQADASLCILFLEDLLAPIEGLK